MMRRLIVLVLAAALASMSAATVAAQEPEADPETSAERVEAPEAGIAMTFPGEWSVVVQMVRHEAELPAELSESAPVDFWIVMEAGAPDGSGCELVMYGEHPLDFEAHLEWIRRNYDADESTSSVSSTSIGLPVGDAVRLDIATEDEAFVTIHLFESQGARYQLRCGASDRQEDDWLSVAETLEAIALEPLDLPAPEEAPLGRGLDVALDFSTVVSVVGPDAPDFPVASLMNAECAFALWVPAEDGSAREWLACTLSDAPLEPAEQQGVPPAELLTESGGECLWRSDYWYQMDRSQVVASAYELTVTPDGQVFGWSDYPAEPLDCPGT
jgi:hypothetical protein